MEFYKKYKAKDEGSHCDLACLFYNQHLHNKLPGDRAKEIVTDAVIIEKEFVTDALPVDLIWMNPMIESIYRVCGNWIWDRCLYLEKYIQRLYAIAWYLYERIHILQLYTFSIY